MSVFPSAESARSIWELAGGLNLSPYIDKGLTTLERVTLDGARIKANARGNKFHRKERLRV